MNVTVPQPPPPPLRQGVKNIRNSVLFRLGVIGILVLVLLIPLSQVKGLVSERLHRADGAKREIASIWGGRQEIGGPVIVVPYRVRYTDEKGIARELEQRARFLPDSLKVSGKLQPERRHRGLFETVVYRLQLHVEATFAPPDFGTWSIAPEEIRWEKAVLGVGIPDLRGIRGEAALKWDGKTVPFSGGSADPRLWGSGLTAAVPLALPVAGAVAHTVSFDLGLQGSEELRFLPFGRETIVDLESPWPSPSFSGAFLPEKRTTSEKGFTARWRISWLGRSYPQQWRDPEVPGPERTEGGAAATDAIHQAVCGSAFGVGLYLPADAYQKTERSLKYAILFVVLTFATFFLYEVLAPVELHPVQYLLVGAAICLFYLLLLSISEQAPFSVAYAVASAAIVALISGYSAAILRGRLRALVLGGLLGLLYGYLYVLLQAEDQALLLGSVGLFAILATLMYLTRRIDWGKGGASVE
jgi:inner membrane protein